MDKASTRKPLRGHVASELQSYTVKRAWRVGRCVSRDHRDIRVPAGLKAGRSGNQDATFLISKLQRLSSTALREIPPASECQLRLAPQRHGGIR